MNNLKVLRLSLRMSREEFAGRLGIYPDYLIDLETNDRPLSAAWTEAVAKGFGVSPADIVDPVFDGARVSGAPLPPPRRFASPVAIRFAMQLLIANIAGVHRAVGLSEDQLADAVISLNGYLADGADAPGNEADRSNRLLKGLQITVLTIVQSCEIDLRNEFEVQLGAWLWPLARLIEDYSRLNASAPEKK